jgi:hypothetical protein
MRFSRWTNPSLPQTLQIGMFLLYIDVVFGVLFGTVFAFPLGTLVVVGSALAGLGIANEYRWGWQLGVAVSALALVPFALFAASEGFGELLNPRIVLSLLFPVAQFALLVHPQSRDYQRIWFN